MKSAICALLCAWACALGSACKYMELRAPGNPGGSAAGTASGKKSDSVQSELPLYLAYPESLGLVDVKAFLESPDAVSKTMIQGADWQARPLSPNERRFLSALKDFLDGHVQEAGSEIGTLASKSPEHLRPFLHIDRGLLLVLEGFPDDAEKEWKRVLRGTDDGACTEGAWRNLYSLYLGRQDFKDAHGLVDEALKASPKNKWANFAKGYLLRMLSPGDDWESFLKEKSSWKDSLFEIQIAYGKFLKDQGQLSEAAKYYSRGLEGAPANGPAWLELAEIYYHLGYLVFAETCLRKSFHYGIADPYIFELYSRVLQDVSTDAAWSQERWRGAERLLEEGFPHDLQSRSMAQLLYNVYCHNGRVEAAANLRDEFWFHFEGPRRIKHPVLVCVAARPKAWLRIPLSEVSYPLIRDLEATDFLDPF
jgi:tetratricopeptide (TPR) repeat protein